MLTLLLLLACTEPHTDTGLDEGEAGSRVIQVPAAEGGEIRYLRVSWPAEGRHPSGAPVVVEAPDGWAEGDLRALQGWEHWGWVSVVPLLPGGTVDDITAPGEYDYRGPASAEVLRDALRYAAGQLPDIHGVRLPDRFPVALSGAPLTLLGRSNGGNLALVALDGLEGVEVGALVQTESPIGDQFTSLELNHNPYYLPGTCTPTTCPWPGLEEVLAIEPSGRTLASGFYEEDTGEWSGRLYLDEDGDGLRDPEEKSFKRMVMGEDEGETLLFPSVELSASLQASGLELPPWVAGPRQVERFWADRDGALHLPAVAAAYPDLMVIIEGSEVDHFQTPEDHPHLLSHYQAWLDAGHTRVRLNADAAYLALASTQGPSRLPDCSMGQPLGWPGIEDCLVPETLDGVELDEPAVHAALLEALDRVEYQDFSEDLDGVL